MERHDKKVFLDLNHVFGSNCDLKLQNSISFIEEDEKIKLVYTAGKSVVKKDIETNDMEFIKLSQNLKSIQCMSVSPNRDYIAICEKIRNQNFLLLNVYGLKTRDSEIKHFKLPQTQKQSTFKIIAYAPSQPKYACCLTGQPDYQLLFLDISRSRGLAVSNFPVQNALSIAISPQNSHLISCAGKNLFKFYKVQDYSFKACEDVKKLPKNRIFTAHTWFDKTKILLGTQRGQLFMVGPVGNNYQVKRNFANVFSQQLVQLKVSSIGVFGKGFILGSNKGHFSLWMKKQQNEQNFEDEYAGDMVNQWRVSDSRASEVICISICPKDENIAVGFQNNNIATLKLSNFINVPEEDRQLKECNQLFNFLHSGFHQAPISMMDVCLHRPIVATLSKVQKSIKLWNYKNPCCELTKKFDSKSDGIQELNTSDSLLSLSIHPFGYYLAVGFCDKLRIYHILESELRNFKEIVLKSACQIKFSNGGNFLAAAYSKQKYNIHLINVYNSYSLQQIARLSDHSNIITQLSWKPDDKALYSVGTDGFVTEWKVDVNPENKEWACRKWSQNNAKYNSVIYEKSSKSILVAGVENNKSVIRQYRLEKQQSHKLYTMGFRITKLQWLTSQWNIPAIIAGTDEGSIKVFNSAFDNIVEQTLNIHLKQVTKINVSPCGRYVFSVGEDGNLFVFQVSLTNRQGFISKRLHDQVNEYELNPLVGVLDDELAQIILIQRNQVNEKIRYIKLLQKNLQDMKSRIIMEDDENSRKHENFLSKLQNTLNSQIDELSSQFDHLKRQKKELELQVQTDFLDTQGNNNKTLQDLQALFQKKLASENQKYFELQKKYEKLRIDQKNQKQSIQRKIKNSLDQLKNDFVDTFKRAQKIHEEKQYELVNGERMFNEKVNQIEQEHEDELKRINKKIIQIGDQKDVKTAQYVTTMQSYNREIAMLRDQTVDFMTNNDRLNTFISDLKRQIKIINDGIHQKQTQLKQKQENMKTREEKIGIFQEQIGDLQKKKQILSYRTWQMRQQMDPKEDQIEFLKEQLYNLQKEFENLLNDEKNLQKTQTLIKKDKDKLNKKIREHKINAKQKQSKFKKICDQITNIVDSKSTDKKYYQAKINELYQQYSGLMTNVGRMNNNSKGLEEMGRHMNHLKKQIQDTNEKGYQGLGHRDQQIRRATIDNKTLIQQLRDLRETRDKLNDDLKNSAKIFENLKRQINQLKNNTILSKKQSPYKSMNRKPSAKNIPELPNANILMRSSSQPLKKGKVMKGKNFDTEKLVQFNKNKIEEYTQKLEVLKLEQRKTAIQLEMIKSQVKDHISTERCSDPLLQKCLIQFQI